MTCLSRIERALACHEPASLPPSLSGVPASVLVPLIPGPKGQCRVVFVRRRADLAIHPGEYSFPGGHQEPGDESAQAAALRETQEEIGHPAHRVQILGELDHTWTYTGFHIRAFVGQLLPPYAFSPQPEELDAVVDLPLTAFADLDAWRMLSFPMPASLPAGWPSLAVPELVVEGHRIWGVTGRILRNLITLAQAAGEP